MAAGAPAVEDERVERVLLASAVGNAAVCLLKIVGGVLSGSVALLADGSDSLLNVASASLAYRFRREARKPPDREHPYGHALVEAYGSILILVLMVATFSFVGFEALDRLLHGAEERVLPIGVAFAALSLALNLTVSAMLRVFGRGSPVAATEARHVSFDVAEGVVTLTGVALGSAFSSLYDVAAAFALLALVAFFVARTLKQLEAEITAASPPREVVERIESALREVKGVVGYHNLRVRRAGDSVFADVHLVVERGLSVEEAHRICDEAESRVKRALEGTPVDIVIHVEPEGDE